MEVITYSEWINQGNRQIAQEIALLAAQAGVVSKTIKLSSDALIGE